MWRNVRWLFHLHLRASRKTAYQANIQKAVNYFTGFAFFASKWLEALADTYPTLRFFVFYLLLILFNHHLSIKNHKYT